MRTPFVDVRVLDNFYQTSSFFPMPVVLVSTLTESGQTNLGPYSLCFPHTIAGERAAMTLIARWNSNTAQNIRRTGVCALNFIPDNPKYTRNCVELGYPGETTEEKMPHSIFTLLPSTRTEAQQQPGLSYPEVVAEAIQIFECTWDDRFPITEVEDSKEYHFVLRIDKIAMQARWRDRLFNSSGCPRLPIDYGYRNNSHFWFTRARRPYRVSIPRGKGTSVDTVKYAVKRCDPDVKWQEAACARLTRVPRIFLNRAIAECVAAARLEGIEEITPEFLDRVRDKRREDRQR